MPISIKGISKQTAELITVERKKEPFRSLEDLRRRCKIGIYGMMSLDKYQIRI